MQGSRCCGGWCEAVVKSHGFQFGAEVREVLVASVGVVGCANLFVLEEFKMTTLLNPGDGDKQGSKLKSGLMFWMVSQVNNYPLECPALRLREWKCGRWCYERVSRGNSGLTHLVDS